MHACTCACGEGAAAEMITDGLQTVGHWNVIQFSDFQRIPQLNLHLIRYPLRMDQSTCANEGFGKKLVFGRTVFLQSDKRLSEGHWLLRLI